MKCREIPLVGDGSQPLLYWTVTVSEPVAQLPLTAKEPVMVAVPWPTNVATFDEKVATELSLDVQVVEFVTSLPFREAKKFAVVPELNVVPGGVEVMVRLCELPPVIAPEMLPLTPATVAVIVTFELFPTPVTSPVELTVAQAVELVHVADRVTSLVPLSKLPVAVSCCGVPTTTASVFAPLWVTVIEFGWFTKKPVHPAAMASRNRAAAPATNDRSSLKARLRRCKTPPLSASSLRNLIRRVA